METATFVVKVFKKLVDSSLKCLLQISCKRFSLVSVLLWFFIVWNLQFEQVKFEAIGGFHVGHVGGQKQQKLFA